MTGNITAMGALAAVMEGMDAQQNAAASSVTVDGRTMSQVLADAAAGAGMISRDDMTMAEYRTYVLDRIASLHIDSSQALASHAVHITDAGFAAMKKDPEYEEWVIDQLRQNFAFHDPWSGICGGSYHVHTFGATKEQYHGESWFPGYMGGQGDALFQSKAIGSQWMHESPKRNTSTVDPNLPMRLRMERLLRKIAMERREFQSEMLEQASKHRKAVEDSHRTGKGNNVPESPTPQFHGVSAAYLLAMLGTGVPM